MADAQPAYVLMLKFTISLNADMKRIKIMELAIALLGVGSRFVTHMGSGTLQALREPT